MLGYEERFNISPVKKYIDNNLRQKIIEFLFNFQCEKESVNEYIEKNAKKEQRYLDSLRRIYWLSLLFCIFLLSYSGVEHYFKDRDYCYGLIPVTIVYLLHVLRLLFFNKKITIISKYGFFLFSFLVWCTLFFVSNLLHKLWVNNEIIKVYKITPSIVNVFTLLVSFSGLFSLSGILIKNYFWINNVEAGINAIFEYTDDYIPSKITKTPLQAMNNSKKSIRKLVEFLEKEIGKSVMNSKKEIGDVVNSFDAEVYFQTAVVKRMKILLGEKEV